MEAIMTLSLQTIGTVQTEPSFALRIDPAYAPGLTGLEGFSHVVVLWHAHQAPAWDAAALLIDKPYRLAPPQLGVFATRSPFRPSGLCQSVAVVTGLDPARGLVQLAWIDAQAGSPVLDIKPYQPSVDRVEAPRLPDWCAHWPANCETSGAFDWGAEFLF
jgi:tRNA (Thr-GGU) A37 N-methylase